MFIVRKNKDSNIGSDGSSLAIALFFFMVCALLCAGILFLANSTTRGVSKSLSIAQNPSPIPSPPPILTSTPTPTPTPELGYENQAAAIDLVYNKLYYDYYYSMTTVENGGQVTIKKKLYSNSPKPNPENLSYEIFSYINFVMGSKGGHDSIFNRDVKIDDAGFLSTDFVVTVKDLPPVRIVVTLSGADYPSKDNLLFQSIKMEFSAADDSGCTYTPSFEYSVPDGKVYRIRYSNYTFIIENP